MANHTTTPDTSTHMPALASAQQTTALLTRWVDQGWLREVDAAFARFLAHEVPGAPPLLLLAAALASHQLGRGHACLDLPATLADPAFALSLPPDGATLPDLDDDVPLPSGVLAGVTLAAWLDALAFGPLVGEGAGDTPLVQVGTRLYLRRYWQYEQNVCAAIEARLRTTVLPSASHDHDARLASALDTLFPRAALADVAADGTPRADWQKIACALAARSAFAIVTGGPGTGKTTTVVKLLALLQSLALEGDADDESVSANTGANTSANTGANTSANTGANTGANTRPLRIRLAAPTGKAAARLNESIAKAVANLPLDAFAAGEAIRGAIPVAVTTLHRLLGTRPDSRRFRHHAGNPLSLDVLVIDEASMVDLEMMNAVLGALPLHARLILLGDKDQLASVEAGAVLGELCQRAGAGHYTPATRDWLAQVTGETIDASLVDSDGRPLDQSIAMLRFSHRFSSQSGIGKLADAINAGEPKRVAQVWKHGFEDLALLDCAQAGDAALKALAIDGEVRAEAPSLFDDELRRHGYRHYLQTLRETMPAHDAGQPAFDAWANGVLGAHGAFQLLCALRRGAWGVEGLNRRVTRFLADEKLIEPTGDWYPGRPVLVTRNDYELGLMNGDIGITLQLPDAGGGWNLRVAFAAGDGTGRIKWILPGRLQAVETVFALTVHKSQGSEFTHAALVLPERLSPVLTRELVYTGVTRARRFLTIASAGGAAIVGKAVQARVLRASGLSAAFADEV